MTTENRPASLLAALHERRELPFHKLVDLARQHGEKLVKNGVSAQTASVAVEEFLISRNPAGEVVRNAISPYDVYFLNGDDKRLVFCDDQSSESLLMIHHYVNTKQGTSDES